MTRLLAPALAALLVVAGLLGAQSPANAEATILSATIENGYPKTLTFKLSARAESDITAVTLSYAITGRGTSAIGKPEDFTPGRQVEVQVAIQVNSGRSYIPVGSEFKYHWEITTADGKTTSGPEQTYLFLPPNREWKSVKNSFMEVHFHGDREALAATYLKAGQETYDRLGQLLNTKLTQLPVRVMLFADEKELDPARPGLSSGAFDAAVTTCGTKVTNDIVLVIPVACGSSDRTDTLRHEFGHILTDAAGGGPLGQLPSWLDEGTAVLAQSSPGSGYISAFDAGARASRLLPFAQMNTPSSDAGTVNLFYGQAYAMVKFLVDNGGQAKFAQLFATIRKGTRFDDALKQVYGFDVASFEADFRTAYGVAAPNPTPVPTKPQKAQSTAVPTSRPATNASHGEGKHDSLDREVLIFIGGALLLALLAVFLFLLSALLSANRRAAVRDEQPPSPDWRRPPGE